MKRQWRARAERLAAELLSVPRDTLEHVPRIIIVGDLQVVIENYRAIVELTPAQIRVATGGGEVAVHGRGLVVRTIVPEQLVVEGAVDRVDLRTGVTADGGASG